MRPRFARTVLIQSVATASLVLAPLTAFAQGGPAGNGPGAGRPEGGMHREGEPRGGGQNEMRRDDRNGIKGDDRKADRDRSNDRGDRDRADRRDGAPDDRRGAEMRRDGGQDDRRGAAMRRDGAPDDRRGAAMRGDDRGPRRGPVRVVTTEQRSRVRNIFRTRNVEVIRNVEFPVRVGAAVPARYAFRPLPREIVDVVPEYEGYDFIDVDGQILILDPDTREIVAVLD